MIESNAVKLFHILYHNLYYLKYLYLVTSFQLLFLHKSYVFPITHIFFITKVANINNEKVDESLFLVSHFCIINWIGPLYSLHKVVFYKFSLSKLFLLETFLTFFKHRLQVVVWLQ